MAEDGSSPGSDRGSPGTWSLEHGGDGLYPLRPVRAPAQVDGRLGALPGTRDQLAVKRGRLEAITVDNGPEFQSKAKLPM